MNAIQKLADDVRALLPDASVELISPRDPRGRWTLDVEHDGWLVVVAWIPNRGFGLTACAVDAEPSGYGENPDELYPGDDPRQIAVTVATLLRTRTETHPPAAVTLGEIRARLGLSQHELADRVEVRQGTISKNERRPDLPVDTLRRMVQAMGGELELWVRFPNDPPMRLLPSTPAQRD